MTKATPSYSKQCAQGRQMAADAVGRLAGSGDVPAFARDAEAVLAMEPGVRAGWFAAIAARLA